MIRVGLLALCLLPMAAQAGDTATARPQPIPNDTHVEAWITVKCTVTEDLGVTGCHAVDPRGVTAEQVRKAIRDTEASPSRWRNSKPGDQVTLFVQVEV